MRKRSLGSCARAQDPTFFFVVFLALGLALGFSPSAPSAPSAAFFGARFFVVFFFGLVAFFTGFFALTGFFASADSLYEALTLSSVPLAVPALSAILSAVAFVAAGWFVASHFLIACSEEPLRSLSASSACARSRAQWHAGPAREQTCGQRWNGAATVARPE